MDKERKDGIRGAPHILNSLNRNSVRNCLGTPGTDSRLRGKGTALAGALASISYFSRTVPSGTPSGNTRIRAFRGSAEREGLLAIDIKCLRLRAGRMRSKKTELGA